MEGNNSDNPSPSSPPFLNEDSLIQILLWLPVISLLRFKSVCKSWRAIIQNPFFIHTHATTTTTTVTTPIFLRYSDKLGRADIFTVSGDEFEVLEDLGLPGPELFIEEDDYYSCPYSAYTSRNKAYYETITMVGCCNGIICLHEQEDNKDLSYRPRFSIYNTISLWNPAIKQCRFLPMPFPLEEKNHDGEYLDIWIDQGFDYPGHTIRHFVGFGFDVKTKDYKVFLITYDCYVLKYYHHARGVQLYSLSSNSWRCIDASDAKPNLLTCWLERHQGHYLNGTYLFISYAMAGEFQQEPTTYTHESFKPVISSFDFTEENFRTIQLPFDLHFISDIPNDVYVLLFGEKIAVTHSGQCRSYLDIWVLNEYGGSESWSKFYSFVSVVARPKFITDNGEFILLSVPARKDVPILKLLNVVTEEIKDLQYDCEGPSHGKGICMNRVGVYKPSLIPIAGNGATDNIIALPSGVIAFKQSSLGMNYY